MARPLNLLLITADQWRADHLDLDGTGPAPTPRLAAVAGEATVFLRHYGQAAPCGPARASLYTGTYLFNHRSVTNGTPLDSTLTNLALELEKAGYEPTLFGYTDTSADPRIVPEGDPRLETYEGVLPGFRVGLVLPEAAGPWLDHLARRGYGRMSIEEAYDRPWFEPAPWRAEDSETAFLVDEALAWLDRQPTTRPWALHLSLIKPHPPWIAALPWCRLVDPRRTLPPVRARSPGEQAALHPVVAALLEQRFKGSLDRSLAGKGPGDLDLATIAGLRAVYAGLVAEVDHQIGRLLDAVRARGEWEDTLLVVTSDHGELLGDHWLLGKGAFFPAAFHVPLLLRDPRATGSHGRRVEAWTRHVDLLPTILERLGLAVPLQGDGRSLSGFLTGARSTADSEGVFWEIDLRAGETPAVAARLGLGAEEAGVAAMRTDRWAFVHFQRGDPILVDPVADPAWTRNRAAEPGAQPVLLSALRAMLDLRARAVDKRLSGCRLTKGGPRGRYDPLPASFATLVR
ncbi:MAG: sulfatase-like hydrolase/transferase [Geminicoccaceae bacterium]|nr:sulfatase-like hydrolase/transferase [Geminicoccaceae bacterium]